MSKEQATIEQAYNLIAKLYEAQKELSPREVRALDRSFGIVARALGLKTELVTEEVQVPQKDKPEIQTIENK